MKKVDLEELSLLFKSGQWCQFRGLKVQKESVELELYVQPELSWFAGHFPEQPVLPGVVQTHWACELAKFFFSTSKVEKVNNLKFITMILPETQLTLSLSFSLEKKAVAFSYKKDEETFSVGSFRFNAI